MNDRLTASTINDEQLDALYRERDTLRASVLDIDAHATPIGVADPNDPDGNPHHYAVTVGALHRALGKVGHTAAPCTAEAERDGAYRERAHLVALLAALHPSHIGYTDPAAIDWLVVTIETPTGQMSWHIAERDRDLFEHVQLVVSTHNVWDGHTTDQKYERLRALTALRAAAAQDRPASTAPPAAGHTLVQGRCPACRGASLFLGSGGYLTCARLDCPDPSAADDLMHGEQPRTTLNNPPTSEEQPMPATDKTPCTATINGPHVPDDETLTCTVGDIERHPANHVGPKREYGTLLWTDHHAGAVPHGAASEDQS